MPVEKINLRLSDCDWNAAVCKIVDTLYDGGIAVVPTETVYGLAARLNDPSAVNKLIQLKGRDENHPFALAFSSVNTIEDICSEMSPLALRLARRCLPGPVSLVLDIPNDSPFWKLPQETQHAVSLQSTVCCRVPDHPLLLTVLGEMNEPIVLTSANKSGQGENRTVDKIIDDFGGGLALVIDDGSLTAPKPSTIVKVSGNDFNVLREGAIKSGTINRLAALMVVFVCTGNICRSPMAEYLCEKILAECLHCSVEELERYRIVVMSAGLSAMEGLPATVETLEVLEEYGINANKHRSLPLNEMHVQFADFIYTMTRHHREQILSQWHNVDSRLSVLRKDGGDIADPYLESVNVFRNCAKMIYNELGNRMEEILKEMK